jgi:hypothetical protein
MRLLLTIIIGLVLIIYPLVNENASSSCGAFERRWLTLSYMAKGNAIIESAVIRSLMDASNGMFAEEYARRYWPEVPPAVTCYFYYWRSMVNEDWARDIRVR